MDRADAMPHDAIVERLEDALLAPGGHRAVAVDPSPEARELRDHVATCEPCRGELEALARTSGLLALAVPDTLEPSPEVRGRILAASSGTSRPAPSESRRAPARPRWSAPVALAAAAVLLLLVGAAIGSIVSSSLRPAPVERGLAAAALAMERVTGDADHRAAELRDPDGALGAVVAFSPRTRELVVISTALPPPPAGERYECYVERDGEETSIGWMRFAGVTSYWAGPIAEPAAGVRAGDRFVVRLEDAGPQPVLSGEF